MIETLEHANAVIAEQAETIGELRARLEEATEQIRELAAAQQSARRTVEAQQHQLEQLLRRVYGAKSEKFNPNQMLFDQLLLEAEGTGESLPAEDPAAGSGHEEPPQRRGCKRKPHGRLPIPEHLERVIVEIDVPEDDRVCPETGEPMVVIGHEESEKLEYRPGRLFVNVYRRPKYASPDRIRGNKAGVVTAPMPDIHPVEKCKADVGLIAHAIVSKFADHLPFYRQDDIFEREGVRIARSTLDGWALRTADAIGLLGEALKHAVLDSSVIFTDDSPVALLEPGRGKTRTARMWVYVKGGTDPPLVAFDFTIDRRKCRPIDYLSGYKGYVHADAYSGYDELFRSEGVIEVGCWAHARRKYDEALNSRPAEASDMLGRIRQLYAFEKSFRGMSPDQRHAARQTPLPPLVERIFERAAELREATVPSEPLRSAVNYTINQRDALRRFLDDGRLEPDNNTAENAIRPLALGRKNWLFAGSERGGQAAALYLGLIQSCKNCGVNPWAYFNDVLRRIMTHPASRLRELLPDQWQPLPRPAAP
jgi:transposase